MEVNGFFRVWYTITVGHVNDECKLGHINSLKHYITIHDEYGWIGLDTSPNEGHVNSPYSSRWVSVPGHPIPRFFFFLYPPYGAPEWIDPILQSQTRLCLRRYLTLRSLRGRGFLVWWTGAAILYICLLWMVFFFSVDGQHPAPVGKLLR